MAAEKISKTLIRLMLGLFLPVTAYALVSCAFVGRTYLFSLIIGAALVACWVLLARRCRPGEKLCAGLGAGRLCALLTLFFLAVNAPVVFILRPQPLVDSATFWRCAVELSQGATLTDAGYVALFPHILGYSAFLSLFLRIFGASTLVAALVNLCLTALSGVVIFTLVNKWVSKYAAAGAYLLWALCPSKMLYNTLVISEPFYTALLLLFVLLVAQLDDGQDGTRRQLLRGALSGAVGAVLLRAMNAARPIAAIPIIAFLIWALLLRGGKLRDKRLWALYLSFAAVLLALYFPLGTAWDGFVADKVGEEPAGLPAYSMYVGFNPDTNGEYSTEDALLLDGFYRETGSAALAQEKMLGALKERLRGGEISFGRLLLRKLSTFLGFDDGGAYYLKECLAPGAYTALVICSDIYYYALLLLALLGGWALLRRADTLCVQMAPMYVLGLTMAHMLVEIAARYHYSVIPMLIIIASAATSKQRFEVTCRRHSGGDGTSTDSIVLP